MVDISSDVGVLDVFKNLNIKPQNAIAEFIDNSVQSYLDNKEKLEQIYKERNEDYLPLIEVLAEGEDIIIRDNCGGISRSDEDRAFKIAVRNPNDAGLGTFGMGMKVGAFFLSDHWQVETKAIDEDVYKYYNINKHEIIYKGNSNIGPIEEKSKKTPRTKVILKNAASLKTTQVSQLKQEIGMFYKNLIKKNKIQIDYFGEPIEYKEFTYNDRPSRRDIDKINTKYLGIDKETKIKRRTAKKGLGKVEWVTDFELNLGDGYKASGEICLVKKSFKTRLRGIRVYWKDRVIRTDWMPGHKINDIDGWFSEKSDSRINGRLSGHIYLNDKFETSFTKDEILWGSKELALVKKLEEHLKNASLRKTEINIKNKNDDKYDFIWEARNQDYEQDDDLSDDDSEEFPEPPIGPGGDGWEDPGIPDGDEPDQLPEPDPKPEDEIPEEGLTDITELPLKAGKRNYLFKIKYFNDQDDDLFKKARGPIKVEDNIVIDIKINKQHEIFHKFKVIENSGTFSVIVSLIISLVAAAETGLVTLQGEQRIKSSYQHHIVSKINEYMYDFSKIHDQK